MNHATPHTPTAEQIAALEMAMTGQSFKIVAYAGAGKTTTLSLISNNLRGRGLYLAFNKAIATEAQGKFPRNVRCQTFHSLAYRHVSRDITAKVSLPRLTPSRLAADLDLSAISVERTVDGIKKAVTLTPAKLANIVSEAVTNFCKTSSTYPAPRHITPPSWLSDADSERLRAHLYPALEKRWLQSIDPRHPSGIGHDIYLKLWTLSNPIIPADFVLFDEAQDADPLMMGALIKQDKQTIYVGDAHQQIYEWRGALNAMKRLPYPQTLLTQSFRFGEPIADVANVFLKALQEEIPLKGNPNRQSMTSRRMTGTKDAILCRTNANAISHLLTGLKLGHKVALEADSARILRFCHAAESLKNGKSAYGIPELAFFNHWGEVQEFSETGEGSDLKTWVKLIEEHGTQTISHAINNLSTPRAADYVVSTAHKAKGLEWGRVQISDDFLYDVNRHSVKITPEELRLLYVACTRAKDVLDVHHIYDLLSGLTSEDKKLVYG
ncbi:DNA helicase [Moraxella caviae]|uniref:DNA helicase n=1 Tax=Moraxella caviae TaxID=34060 RepID=A0A1T0A886_9GAMM|nr:UvrD-helicase domain-containing protein [Moraxella caviae]OOR91946.1 DNA helicase [Moraxella caviae]STZ09731.1 DNA helicase IV [Moraxella caviae]VEW11230.1 DNA helicase IV [Moraxella caviae]